MIETYPVNNRGDWLALRRRDVTASEIAALFGIHPYRTALQVYASKVDGIDPRPNSAMRRGRILEPAVAEAVREEKPHWIITKANTYFRDPEMRLGATPDWFVGAPGAAMGLLETKTVNPKVFEQSWSNGAPLAYIMQTLTQMMLGNLNWGVIACLVTSPDFPLYIYEVNRHPDAEAAIIAKVAEFWRMIERGTPPPPDFAKDAEYIEAMFPCASKGSVIDLTGDNELPGQLANRAEININLKLLEARKNEIDAEIKAKLGEHETGLCGDYKITWKMQHRKETITPAKDFRVFRVATKPDDFTDEEIPF